MPGHSNQKRRGETKHGTKSSSSSTSSPNTNTKTPSTRHTTPHSTSKRKLSTARPTSASSSHPTKPHSLTVTTPIPSPRLPTTLRPSNRTSIPITISQSTRHLSQTNQHQTPRENQNDPNGDDFQPAVAMAGRNSPEDIANFIHVVDGVRREKYEADEGNSARAVLNTGATPGLGYSTLTGSERLKMENKLMVDEQRNLILDPRFRRFMPDVDATAPDVVRLATKSDFNLDFDLEVEWQRVNSRQQLKQGSFMAKHQESEFQNVFAKMVDAKQREFQQERIHLEAIRGKKHQSKLQKVHLVQLHHVNMAKLPEEIALEQFMAEFIQLDRDANPLEGFRREQEITEQIEAVKRLKRKISINLAESYGLSPDDIDIDSEGGIADFDDGGGLGGDDDYAGDYFDPSGSNLDQSGQLTPIKPPPQSSLPHNATKPQTLAPSPFGFDPRNPHKKLTTFPQTDKNPAPGGDATAMIDSFRGSDPDIDEADILEHYYGYGDILEEMYEADLLTSSTNSILHKLEHAIDPEYDEKAEQLVRDIANEKKISSADLAPKKLAQQIKQHKENLVYKTTTLFQNEFGELKVAAIDADRHKKLQIQKDNISIGGSLPGAGGLTADLTIDSKNNDKGRRKFDLDDIDTEPTKPQKTTFTPKSTTNTTTPFSQAAADQPIKSTGSAGGMFSNPDGIPSAAVAARRITLSKADMAEFELNQEKLTETGRNDRFDNFNDEPDFADMKRRLHRGHNEQLKAQWAREDELSAGVSLFTQQEKSLEMERQKTVLEGQLHDGYKPMFQAFNQFQPVDKNKHVGVSDPYASKKRHHGELELVPIGTESPDPDVGGQKQHKPKLSALDADLSEFDITDPDESPNRAMIRGLKYGVNEDEVIYKATNNQLARERPQIENVTFAHTLAPDELGLDSTLIKHTAGSELPYYERQFKESEDKRKSFEKRHLDVLGEDMRTPLDKALQPAPKSTSAGLGMIGKGKGILGEGDLTDADSDDNQHQYDPSFQPGLDRLGLDMTKQQKYALKNKIKKPKRGDADSDVDIFEKNTKDEIDREIDQMKFDAKKIKNPYDTREELDAAMRAYYTSPTADPNSTQGYQLGETAPIEELDIYHTSPHVPQDLVDNALDPGAGQDPLQFDDSGKNVLKSTANYRNLQQDYARIMKRRRDAADKHRVLEATSTATDAKMKDLKEGLDDGDKGFFNTETGELYTSRPAKPSYTDANRYLDVDHIEDLNMMDAAGEDFVNEMFAKGRGAGGIGPGERQEGEEETAELNERLENLSQKMKQSQQDAKAKQHLQQGGVKMHPTDYLSKFMMRIHPDMFAAESYRVVDDKTIINIKKNLNRKAKSGEELIDSIDQSLAFNATNAEYETGEFKSPDNIRYYGLTGEFLQQHNSKMLSDFNTLVDFYKKLSELDEREKSDPFLPHLSDNNAPKNQSFVFFLRPTQANPVKKPKNVKLMKPIWDESGNEIRFDRTGRMKRPKTEADQKNKDGGADDGAGDDDDLAQFLSPETMDMPGEDSKDQKGKKKNKKYNPEDQLDPKGRTIEDFYVDGGDGDALENQESNDGQDLPHLRAVRVWFTPPPKLPHGADPHDHTTAWMLQLERTMVEVLSGLGDADVPSSIIERWKTELTATYVSKQWNKLVEKKSSYLDKIFKTEVKDLVAPSESQIIDLYKDSNMAYYHMFPYASKEREADFRAQTHPRHHLFNAMVVGGYISFDPTVVPKQRVKALHDLNRLVTVNYQHLDCFRWWNKSISQQDILEQAKIEEYISTGNQNLKSKGKLDPYQEELMNLFPYHDEERQNIWPSPETGEDLSIRFAIHFLPEGEAPTALLVSSRKLMLEMHGTQANRATILKDILQVGSDVKARKVRQMRRDHRELHGGDADDQWERGDGYNENDNDFETKTEQVFKVLSEKHQDEMRSVAQVQRLLKKRDALAKETGVKDPKLLRSVELKKKLKLMKLNALNNITNGDSDDEIDESELGHGDNETDGDDNDMNREENLKRKKYEKSIQKNYLQNIMTNVYGAKNRQHLLTDLVGDEGSETAIDNNNTNPESNTEQDYDPSLDNFIFNFSPEELEHENAQIREEMHQKRLKHLEKKYPPPTSMNDVCLQVRVPQGISEIDFQKHLMTHAYILYDEWKLHFVEYHVELTALAERKKQLEKQYTESGTPPNDPLFKNHLFTVSELLSFLSSDLASKEKRIVNPKNPEQFKMIPYQEIVLNRVKQDQPQLLQLVNFYNNMSTITYRRIEEDPNPEKNAAKQQQKMEELRELLKKGNSVDLDSVSVDPDSLNTNPIKPGGQLDRIQRDLAMDAMKGLLKQQGKKLKRDDENRFQGRERKPKQEPDQSGLKLKWTPAPETVVDQSQPLDANTVQQDNSQPSSAIAAKAALTKPPTEPHHHGAIHPATSLHTHPHSVGIANRLLKTAKMSKAARNARFEQFVEDFKTTGKLPTPPNETVQEETTSQQTPSDPFEQLHDQLIELGIDPKDDNALEQFAEKEMQQWEARRKQLKRTPQFAEIYSDLKQIKIDREHLQFDINDITKADPLNQVTAKQSKELQEMETKFLKLTAMALTYKAELEFLTKHICKREFPRVSRFLYQDMSSEDSNSDGDDGHEEQDKEGEETDDVDETNPIDPVSGNQAEMIKSGKMYLRSDNQLLFRPDGSIAVAPGANLSGPELIALEQKRKAALPSHQQTSVNEHFTIKDRMSKNQHMYNSSSDYTAARDSKYPLGTYEERLLKASQRRGDFTPENMAKAKDIVDHHKIIQAHKLGLAPPSSSQPPTTPAKPAKLNPVQQARMLLEQRKMARRQEELEHAAHLQQEEQQVKPKKAGKGNKKQFDFGSLYEENLRRVSDQYHSTQEELIRLHTARVDSSNERRRAALRAKTAADEASLDHVAQQQQTAIAIAPTEHARMEAMINAHNSGFSPNQPHKSQDKPRSTTQKMAEPRDIEANQRLVQGESLNATLNSYQLGRSQSQHPVLSAPTPNNTEPHRNRRERRSEMNEQLDRESHGKRNDSVNTKMKQSMGGADDKRKTNVIVSTVKALDIAEAEIKKKNIAKANIRMAVLHGADANESREKFEFVDSLVHRNTKGVPKTIFNKIPMDIQLAELNWSVDTVVSNEMVPANATGTATSEGYFGNVYDLGHAEAKSRRHGQYRLYENSARADKVRIANQAPVKTKKNVGPQLIPL